MTDRETDLLISLTQRVRCLAAAQLAAGWWGLSPSGATAARRSAAGLVKRGLLLRERVLIDPMLPLDAPVVSWQPREKAPDAKQIAAQLNARWTRDVRPATVYFASWTAARLFGGYGGGITTVVHVTHDLHVAELYLRFRQHSASDSLRWVSEDVRTVVRGAIVPDAYILNPSGVVEWVIEFGGRYSAERVAKFHAYCQQHELAYQLW